MTNLYT